MSFYLFSAVTTQQSDIRPGYKYDLKSFKYFARLGLIHWLHCAWPAQSCKTKVFERFRNTI